MTCSASAVWGRSTLPGGFATTAAAYRDFLSTDGLDKRIHDLLDDLDVDDVDALAKAGRTILLQEPHVTAKHR